VQNAIVNMHVGTMIPHFKKGDFFRLKIPMPQPEMQIAIGSWYMEISRKIDLNRRMNETLEAMARAIFQGWFVAFGPTRAKQEGRPPYLAPDLWSLFPNRLDDDGKPEGWVRGNLGQYMVNFDAKRVPVSNAERAKRKGPYPYHGATSVMDHVDNYLFDGTYVLVGEDGSVVKENGAAFTQYVWGKIWVNNHAHVLQGTGSVSTEQLLMYFQHEQVAPYVTGAVQLKLSQGRMNTMPFLFAGEDVCRAFSRLVDPLFARLRSNVDEMRTLAATRDLLLPKLMSGELRIRDAERVAETVL
jgi:type I restriction enzyme S subunit